jgi:hypothetical protein
MIRHYDMASGELVGEDGAQDVAHGGVASTVETVPGLRLLGVDEALAIVPTPCRMPPDLACIPVEQWLAGRK